MKPTRPVFIFTFCDLLLWLSIFRTLTTPVEMIKCLKSIREHAFVSSEYPVIITLEDHLTPDLQAKVAEVSACWPICKLLFSLYF